MTPMRCPWAGSDPAMIAYHDREWGVPTRDDRELFELLVLEGAQAGLSWKTILHRRDGYRRAFAGFDAERVARFGDAERGRLLQDPGIIRNRAKIDAAIGNARAFLAVRDATGSFSDFVWRFVDHRPVDTPWQRPEQVPAQTPASRALSRALGEHGFKFTGPVICYAFMQAAGLVNDHLADCHRRLAHPDTP